MAEGMIRGLLLMGSVVVLGVVATGARAADRRELPGKLWGDFGVGVGHLNATSGPTADSGDGAWVDMVVGGRISDHWLLGFNLGAVGIKPSSSNFNRYDSYSSIYGEAVTNVFLDLRYEPYSDRGWFVGGGGGRVLYHNHALESVTGNVRSGQGAAGIARIGYDWRVGVRTHFETQFSVEAGSISLGGPLTGSFSFSAAALSVHVAYH